MDVSRKDVLRVAKHVVDLRREALRVYRPLPGQVPIFESSSKRLVIRGGNQSGKTLSGAILLARRIEEAESKKKTGKALVVSLDFSLLAKNCYAKLFERGGFDVCTACGLSKHGCEQFDQCGPEPFEEHCTESPPIIPKRKIKRIVWVDKARKVPDRIYLKSGWVMDFRSCESGREKFQGDQWDECWIDEEGGSDEDVMNEIERGLLKRNGRLWWTATPLAAGVKLLQYSEAAQEEKAEREALALKGTPEEKDLYYEEVVLSTDDNTTISDEAKEHFFEDMSEEEEEVRRQGAFLIQAGLVYKQWDKQIHLVDPFKIPDDWTVYDFVDPGHANAFAILFLAVNPSEEWVVFDELYLRRVDIPDVVKEWRSVLAGGSLGLSGSPHWSQRTGIDPASKQIQSGMKLNSVKTQIIKARQAQNFRSFEGDSGMFNCPNSRQAGIFAVQNLLQPRAAGSPRLTVMRHCVYFQREIRRYRYPRPATGKEVNEKTGPIKKEDHLMDLIRYAALMGCPYVPPYRRPLWGRHKTPLDIIRRRRQERLHKLRQQAYDCT